MSSLPPKNKILSILAKDSLSVVVGKCWNQIFFTGSWPGIVWMIHLCQIFIPTLWLVTPPCFLAEIAQILQKVIVFFQERGEEIKPWFWHIWIAEWLTFFRTIDYFRDFDHLQGETERQRWIKSVTFESFS